MTDLIKRPEVRVAEMFDKDKLPEERRVKLATYQTQFFATEEKEYESLASSLEVEELTNAMLFYLYDQKDVEGEGFDKYEKLSKLEKIGRFFGIAFKTLYANDKVLNGVLNTIDLGIKYGQRQLLHSRLEEFLDDQMITDPNIKALFDATNIYLGIDAVIEEIQNIQTDEKLKKYREHTNDVVIESMQKFIDDGQDPEKIIELLSLLDKAHAYDIKDLDDLKAIQQVNSFLNAHQNEIKDDNKIKKILEISEKHKSIVLKSFSNLDLEKFDNASKKQIESIMKEMNLVG